MIIVDVLIVLVLVLYGYLGYKRGFVSGLAELLAFAIGLAMAFLLYKAAGDALFKAFHIPRGFADLIGFMAIWTVLELILMLVWKQALQKRVPEHLTENPTNQIAGVVPSLMKGIIFIVIVLSIVAVAPIPAAAKTPFVDSNLGKAFLGAGTAFQQQFNNVFGQALRDTLAFKTIKTGSNETTQLGFTDPNPKVCAKDEARMLQMVNQERLKVGLGPVTNDDQLKAVGRAHSRDMLVRGYFSHNTPEGLDPFDRMEKAGITYQVAGENLAFAPTTEIAMSGLMNSPGHKANILKTDFTKLGVGCMDGGVRGKMFSQEFKGE
ncbi:hypothetical protein EXS54_02125 [Patescibacteria group bacterium]|nr:hypothetical protein [Patescibacteria group bacterium]